MRSLNNHKTILFKKEVTNPSIDFTIRIKHIDKNRANLAKLLQVKEDEINEIDSIENDTAYIYADVFFIWNLWKIFRDSEDIAIGCYCASKDKVLFSPIENVRHLSPAKCRKSPYKYHLAFDPETITPTAELFEEMNPDDRFIGITPMQGVSWFIDVSGEDGELHHTFRTFYQDDCPDELR